MSQTSDSDLQTESTKLLTAARHSYPDRPAILHHITDLVRTRPAVSRAILRTVLSFASDERDEVKTAIVDLVETAVCRVGVPLEAKHYETVAVAVEALNEFLGVGSVGVLKRVLQCFTSCYSVAFLVL